MGIGYYLCPATMQGGEILGARNLIGLFLVKAGGALIDNMAILFASRSGILRLPAEKMTILKQRRRRNWQVMIIQPLQKPFSRLCE